MALWPCPPTHHSPFLQEEMSPGQVGTCSLLLAPRWQQGWAEGRDRGTGERLNRGGSGSGLLKSGSLPTGSAEHAGSEGPRGHVQPSAGHLPAKDLSLALENTSS